MSTNNLNHRPKAPKRAWAKTDKTVAGNPPCKTVQSHALETHIVANTLVRSFFPELDPQEQKRIVWLASNHDIGKATPTFQRKNQPDYRKPEGEYGHQILSAVILRTEQNATFEEGQIIGAHHGVFQHKETKEPLCYRETDIIEQFGLEKNMGDTSWKTLRKRELVTTNTQPLPKKDIFPSGRIAGFITLCDYVASSLKTQSKDWETDLLEANCKTAIQSTLAELQLGNSLSFQTEIKDFSALLEKEPRQFQNLEWKGPGVYLLEAPTGAGKTEAAIFLLLQAILTKDVSGGYFGLPTTLTSNRIYRRLCESLQKKINTGRIQLTHSKAWLEENNLQGFGENITADAYAWLCGPNRSLAAPLGVGTIDQALMGTIHTNHWPLRSLFLHHKLIICDEVHSYDNYTTCVMGHAIRNWTRLQNCSVLCLSATLSDKKKRMLLGESFPLTDNEFGFSYLTKTKEAYQQIEVSDSIPYPIIALKKEACAQLDPKDPTYQSTLEKAVAQAKAGAKVLWICNSVHNAQETFKSTKNHPLARLLHSKFTAEDRSQKERDFLEEFEDDNTKGMLLIGTQVLEQSLDLNADSLYTEICPIELLFQRAGRLWRKPREHRPFDIREYHILTTSKNPTHSGIILLGRTSKVYRDHYQLLRAWQWVNQTNTLDKTKVREALHFKLKESTGISQKAERDEAAELEKAKNQAASTGPQLCKPEDPVTKRLLGNSGQIDEMNEGASTRLSTLPQVDLVLYQNTKTFWNGTEMENPRLPTKKDRVQIEKNSVSVATHLLSNNPRETSTELQLGYNKFQWIPETEFSYGMTYHPDLGLIQNSRNSL